MKVKKSPMTVTTLSSKGQITIPISARRALGIHSGDSVLVEYKNGEIIIRAVPSFMKLEGFLGKGKSRNQERKAAMTYVAQKTRQKL